MEINIFLNRVEGVTFLIYTINMYTYKAEANIPTSVQLFNSQKGK